MFTKTRKFLAEKCTAVSAGAVAGSASLMGSMAYAGIDLTGVNVDTTDYTLIASFLVAALVTFWGIKKGLALVK